MTEEVGEPPTAAAGPGSPVERAALEKHPHLDRYLGGDPVKRFVNPPAYDGLRLAEPEPLAIDALVRPGVIDTLRDILDDLAGGPGDSV